jgi:hypothetical protein
VLEELVFGMDTNKHEDYLSTKFESGRPTGSRAPLAGYCYWIILSDRKSHGNKNTNAEIKTYRGYADFMTATTRYYGDDDEDVVE